MGGNGKERGDGLGKGGALRCENSDIVTFGVEA